QQIAIAQRGVVVYVVQNAAIGAAAHDGRVRRPAVVAAIKGLELGLDLVLVHARPADFHGPAVSLRAKLGGAAHHGNFGGALEQPHLVQVVRQRHDLIGRARAQAGLAAQVIDPADHSVVELEVHPHGVEQLVGALYEPRQNVVYVVDGEGVVGAVVAAGAFLAGTRAVPDLAGRIALPAEEDVLAVGAARNQHDDRFRLGETRQIVKVAILTVGVVCIAVAQPLRGGRHHGHAARPHDAHELGAPLLEFRLIHSDSDYAPYARPSARRGPRASTPFRYAAAR